MDKKQNKYLVIANLEHNDKSARVLVCADNVTEACKLAVETIEVSNWDVVSEILHIGRV